MKSPTEILVDLLEQRAVLSRLNDELPRARVVKPQRRWLRTFAIALIPSVLVAACIGFGALLSRIDQARAEAHRAYAHTKLLEAQLVYVRSHPIAPPPDPRVDVCLRRTKALRSAHLALVRTGLVSMPGDPGGDWGLWDVELAGVRR